MQLGSAKFKVQNKLGQRFSFWRKWISFKKGTKASRDKTASFWFQHLFALRSKHKGQERTYYLAADSEVDMTKWVECLCNVCGCKPVDNQDEGISCWSSYHRVRKRVYLSFLGHTRHGYLTLWFVHIEDYYGTSHWAKVTKTWADCLLSWFGEAFVSARFNSMLQ